MTGEQETLVNNVDRLVADNESLKQRLDALEGGGAGGGLSEIRGELEDVRRAVADTNNSLEDFRQEFSFVQGSIEEADHRRVQFKETIASVNSSIEELGRRLADIEIRSAGEHDAVESLKGSVAAMQATLDGLAQSLSDVSKRTAALEEKAAGAPAAEPAAARKREAAPEVEPPETMYLRGYKETKAHDYAKATETFSEFLSTYPRHKFAGNAQYWLGEIYYAKGDWEMAILEFDKVIKRFPESEKVPAAILKQGFSFEKLGSNKEARVLLEQVLEKYPKSPEAGLARKRLGSLK
ncbi:MAG: tol-pal system protein YbgF [Thermodesulfobacteriota bacterium]